MSKIHLRGIPCHCQNRWPSTQLSSVTNMDRVTCRNCRIYHASRPDLTPQPAHD